MWLTLTHHTAQEKVAIMSADSDFYKSVNEDDTRVYVVVVSVCVCVCFFVVVDSASLGSNARCGCHSEKVGAWFSAAAGRYGVTVQQQLVPLTTNDTSILAPSFRLFTE